MALLGEDQAEALGFGPGGPGGPALMWFGCDVEDISAKEPFQRLHTSRIMDYIFNSHILRKYHHLLYLRSHFKSRQCFYLFLV